MAGARFTMNMGGLCRMTRLAIRRVGDLQAAANEIGEMLVSSTKERFDEGIAPDGSKWKPSIRAKAEGGKTLVDDAVLKNSIGYEASPHMVVVGSSIEDYAAIHQYGGKTGRNHSVDMPARPFIGFSEEDRQEAQQILLDHIRKAFGG